MENASKALLIAGSVLIAILLIAVGLKIFNSTNGTTEATKSTMDTTAATSFNMQFVPYGGLNKTKSEALTLVNKIIASNSVNKNHQILYFVIKGSATASSGGTSSSVMINKINSNDKYDIILEYDNGYINIVKFNAK